MSEADELQAHLALMRSEPVVRLTGNAAVFQAYRLRTQGMSYEAIRIVMGLYHGEWYTRQRWFYVCRDRARLLAERKQVVQ